MRKLRLRTTIMLNGEHAISPKRLTEVGKMVERAIATSLPDDLRVDTVKVTKIKPIVEEPTHAA